MLETIGDNWKHFFMLMTFRRDEGQNVYSDIGDFMMVTDLRSWWQNHYVSDSFRYVGDFSKLLNRSPTS